VSRREFGQNIHIGEDAGSLITGKLDDFLDRFGPSDG